jgi:uncharacterized protein YbjT (DUF2867 family)
MVDKVLIAGASGLVGAAAVDAFLEDALGTDVRTSRSRPVAARTSGVTMPR